MVVLGADGELAGEEGELAEATPPPPHHTQSQLHIQCAQATHPATQCDHTTSKQLARNQFAVLECGVDATAPTAHNGDTPKLPPHTTHHSPATISAQP